MAELTQKQRLHRTVHIFRFIFFLLFLITGALLAGAIYNGGDGAQVPILAIFLFAELVLFTVLGRLLT